jgi:hypothetical protein
MTIGGWIIMFVSVGSVTSFFFWTLYRVMTVEPPPENSIKAKTPDID